MIQVEVEFLIRHTMDELKDAFIRLGRFPEWRATKILSEDGANKLVFLESRTIGFDLNTEAERYAWFVFSFEACGELKKRIVIPNIISSTVDLNNLALDEFLGLCRECLVAPPLLPNSAALQDITKEHVS